MSEPTPSLVEQSQEFADELSGLLCAVLPNAPGVVAEFSGDRAVVKPEEAVPIRVGGERLASLDVHLRCRLDSHGIWLAVESSTFRLRLDLDRTPLVRFDYVRDATTAPCSHLQVHAHRGALSHLLSRAGHPNAHDMSKLHLPLGGARFRPCLEDVLQFLVEECRVDHQAGWRDAVHTGRASWRRKQTRAAVRDFPEEAAEVLRQLAYEVVSPQTPPETRPQPMYGW
jgi:hypothetical protein